ncbi:MAG: class I SAM-dependent methyltransferase, partial [Magnetococcales bacterium]|nr:class I SAM-dependent methyltransferase [Magnetococcales bacterium]
MTEYSSSDWELCFQSIHEISGRYPNSMEQIQLQQFAQHLLTWNQSFNLIGPSAISTLLNRH